MNKAHQSHSSSSSGRSDASAGRRKGKSGSAHMFPLPDGYFGSAELSQEQEREFEALVDQRLEAALADERAIQSRQAQHLPRLDPREWKFVSTHEQLRIYRSRRRRGGAKSSSKASNNNSSSGLRRFPSSATTPNAATSDAADQVRVSGDDEEQLSQPSVIGIGRVEGCMEDVIYGLFDTNRAEMLTSVSFLDNTTWDGTVLHCIQAGVPEDPFRLLGVKWLLSRFASSVFIAPRDWCYVVASGIKFDAQGQRYGYVVTHSIALPSCPPFNYRETGVIRGKMFFHFLFRESTPGFIEVFSRGIFDPAGDLIRAFVNVASAKMISGFFRTIDCAEAKKITILARRHARERLGSPELESFCSMCIKRGSSNMFASVRLKSCGVCGVTICTKCAVKKRIFAYPAKTIRCCSGCLLAAKRMTGIHPAEPEFSLLSDSAVSHKHPPHTGTGLGLGDLRILDEESSSHSSGPSGSSGSKSIVTPEFDNLGRMLLNRKADKEEFTNSYQSDRNTMGVEQSIDETASAYDQFYPDTLSDLDSDEYHFSSGSEDGKSDKEERDPEQELLRLLKQQSLSDSMGPRSAPSQQTGEDSSWQASTPNASSDSTPPSPQGTPMHQNSLYQRMLDIQNTAQQVYELTQANERIIQNLH